MKKIFKKNSKICYCILLVCTLIASTSCKQKKQDLAPLSTNLSDQTLTLGTSPDYPPFESKILGEFVGYDIDVAHAIAAELGFTLKIIDIDFNGLIPALTTGRVDFVMAAMSDTPRRRWNVDFSQIYYKVQLALLSRNTLPITSPRQLNGKTVGVQIGSVMQNYAIRQGKKYNTMSIHTANRNLDLIQELKIGRVDVIVLEEVQANKFAQLNHELTATPIEADQLYGYAIAFKKESKPLVKAFNNALDKLRESGKLAEIEQKWIPNSTETTQ